MNEEEMRMNYNFNNMKESCHQRSALENIESLDSSKLSLSFTIPIVSSSEALTWVEQQNQLTMNNFFGQRRVSTLQLKAGWVDGINWNICE